MMKQLQKKYTEVKAKYDTAFKAKNWKVVEEIEDEYLDAEIELVEKGLELAAKHMTKEDVETIKKKWTNPKYTEKVVGLMLQLEA